jgi:hypothetical protein
VVRCYQKRNKDKQRLRVLRLEEKGRVTEKQV